MLNTYLQEDHESEGVVGPVHARELGVLRGDDEASDQHVEAQNHKRELQRQPEKCASF